MDKIYSYHALRKGKIGVRYTGTNLSRFRELLKDAFPEFPNQFSRQIVKMKMKLGSKYPKNIVIQGGGINTQNGYEVLKVLWISELKKGGHLVIDHTNVKTKEELIPSGDQLNSFLDKYGE